MTPITLTSHGQVGTIVDALVQGGSLAQLSEGERAPIVADARAMQRVSDDAAAAVAEVCDSRELTALGRRVAAKRVLQEARAAMESHDAKVARVKAAASETRAKAIEPPTSERTQEILMLEREVRDRLAGKDALQVNIVYTDAIAKSDWLTVSAIERAPSSFALITSDQREVGDMMKLRASPLSSQVISADRLAFIYQSVASAVHTELERISDDLGVDLTA